MLIEPLSEATWPALEALFREGGDPRSCWCQWWRLRSRDFNAAKVPQLRQRLRNQVASESPPGLVALEEDDEHGVTTSRNARAIGWVGLGPSLYSR